MGVRLTPPRAVPRLVCVVALCVVGFASQPSSAQVTVDLVMSDGVKLATDLYTVTSDPRPLVLIRTPHGRASFAAEAWTLAEAVGVNVVVQDSRGQGASQGMEEGFRGALADGQETVEWIEVLGWSDGTVVGWGTGAEAITQALMAPGAPDVYRCQHIVSGTADLADGLVWSGGVRRVELDAWLDSQGASEVAEGWAAHPDVDDPWWDLVRVDADEAAAVETVGVHVTGWYDIFAPGTIDGFVALQEGGGYGARGRQHLVIGPWAFDGSTGELSYPEVGIDNPGPPLDQAWLTDCVYGEETGALDALPAVQVFVMGAADEEGAPGSAWQAFDAWPPPAAPTHLYLRADGRLELDPPEGDEAPETYAHDPEAPTPAVGGSHLTLPSGALDQGPVEALEGVVVYTSAMLDEAAEIIGPLSARLWVHAAATETDVAVRVSDVYPDGRSMLLVSGIRRFKGTGKPQQVDIDLGVTGVVVNAGHRLRLSVSGALAGAFDLAAEPFSALVVHSEAQPSHLTLPVRSGLGVTELPEPEVPEEPEPGPEQDPIAEAAAEVFDAPDAGVIVEDAGDLAGFDGGAEPGPEADAGEQVGPVEDATGGTSTGDVVPGSGQPGPAAPDGSGGGAPAVDVGSGSGSGGGGGCRSTSDGTSPWWVAFLAVMGWLVRRRQRGLPPTGPHSA